MSGNPFRGMSRREFIAKMTGAGAAALLMDYAGPVIEKAYGAGPCSGQLTDIEHIVLLMQENRSFDHYFGTLSSIRGFSDPSPTFQQKGWNPRTQALDPAGTTIPFRLDTTRGPFLDGECVNDPEHQWTAIHLSWNGGANDNWLPAQANTRTGPYVPMTMGYYTRQDIPIHHLLADTFTICDGYHCSLLTGTLPNRLYWMSAWNDPAGTNGGPQLVEPGFLPLHQYSWRIMPENLEDAGVSWKVYQNKDAGRVINTPISNNGLVQAFKQSGDPRSNLARYGIAPGYPVDFAADVKANRLPKVSWLVPNFLQSEHPALPVALGAVAMVTALRILLSNPAVWEKTALIISYDENGGFFDHVTPPTAPPGTRGEWVTVPDINSVPGSGGIRGPLGLGFRVPCIVVSPFSRGGLMVHDIFDHTSQLKLISKFATPPNPSRPNLSHPLLAAVPKLPQCIPNVVLGTSDGTCPAIPYRVPYPQSMPGQESTPVRGIPSGLCV